MAAARLPSSKLETARRFAPGTATSTLADELGLPENIDENHETMDWLVERQNSMSPCREAGWRFGTLRPDVDMELPLPAGPPWLLPRRQKRAAASRVRCDRDGWPVAAFEGNAADPSTVAAQVEKLRRRFRLSRVVLVGGMLTDAREDLEPGGLDQCSACARDPVLG